MSFDVTCQKSVIKKISDRKLGTKISETIMGKE